MTSAERSTTALILAPVGRDAGVAAGMLREADIGSLICPDLDCLASELSNGVGFVLVTEEALVGRDLRKLCAWIDDQPVVNVEIRGRTISLRPGDIRVRRACLSRYCAGCGAFLIPS